MDAWLKDFELDTGKRKIKPYNPAVGREIAEMLRPSLGDQIPKDPKAIAKSFGTGWWKPLTSTEPTDSQGTSSLTRPHVNGPTRSPGAPSRDPAQSG